MCMAVTAGVFSASAAYHFFNGEDWVKIDQKTCPIDVKNNMKLMTLKAVEGGSLFSGTPILPQQEMNLSGYVEAVDMFYSNVTNREIPLYFALKIASMEKQGIPEAQVRLYRTAIQKKVSQTK